MIYDLNVSFATSVSNLKTKRARTDHKICIHVFNSCTFSWTLMVIRLALALSVAAAAKYNTYKYMRACAHYHKMAYAC
jgi:hypothetical protein